MCIAAACKSVTVLVGSFDDAFPRLVLGDLAKDQLLALSGAEPYFPQILRHLRALQRAAESWTEGAGFRPDVTSSPESNATLTHGQYGPQRDFPTPEPFPQERWSDHTKFTGGPGGRLYYKFLAVEAVASDGSSERVARVAVGYVGPHLQTVKYH